VSAAVTVLGIGVARGRPDRAHLTIAIEQAAASPAEAFALVAERVDAMATTLRDLGVPDDDWITRGVSIGEDWDFRQNSRVLRGWIASNRIEVRIVDSTLVGRVASEAVNVAGAKVDGPRWVIDPSNPVHAEARRLAALDARDRAMTYASALGLRLGAVEAIVEPGAAPAVGARAALPQVAAMAVAEGPPSMNVSEGDVDVRAVVTVAFTLLV
jgi:uncharacterized protein YggE